MKITSQLLLLLLYFFAPQQEAMAETPSRPNVLLLIVDDLNTWQLGDTDRYAGKVVAPNIRRLAESGVEFRRAYTASPVCCPSRTAFLSGVRPWQSGLYDNGLDSSGSDALKKATPLPGVFKTAGYLTAAYGKVGHGWNLGKVWDDYMPHRRDPAPPNAPFLPFTRGEQDWGPTHLAEEKMNDTKYADAAIKQLQQKHDKPFFVACGLFHPHMPWYVPKKYFDMFPLDEVKLPPIQKNDLDDVPPLGQAITKGKSKFVDQVIEGKVHPEGVRAYLAATAYADAQIGRVLDALDQSDYRDNTVVVFLSDHGFHLGEKHHWQKSTLWEEATHCNLVVRVPGTTKPKGVCERFVSLQDLYPTLMDWSFCSVNGSHPWLEPFTKRRSTTGGAERQSPRHSTRRASHRARHTLATARPSYALRRRTTQLSSRGCSGSYESGKALMPRRSAAADGSASGRCQPATGPCPGTAAW